MVLIKRFFALILVLGIGFSVPVYSMKTNKKANKTKAVGFFDINLSAIKNFLRTESNENKDSTKGKIFKSLLTVGSNVGVGYFRHWVYKKDLEGVKPYADVATKGLFAGSCTYLGYLWYGKDKIKSGKKFLLKNITEFEKVDKNLGKKVEKYENIFDEYKPKIDRIADVIRPIDTGK